jgi:hypothetical protein
VRFSLKKIACSPVVATNLYGPSGFARDDKGEGSASIDEGDWDGRVRCAASVERDLSIRITKPHESVKSKFVIPTRISCHASLDRSAYAPFRKEGRMEFANAPELYRKSGGAKPRDLQCAPDSSQSFGFSHTLRRAGDGTRDRLLKDRDSAASFVSAKARRLH